MLACSGAAVVAVFADGSSGSDGSAATSAGTYQTLRAAKTRGCLQRVEGVARITPNRRRDTILGPIALIALPITYRDFA